MRASAAALLGAMLSAMPSAAEEPPAKPGKAAGASSAAKPTPKSPSTPAPTDPAKKATPLPPPKPAIAPGDRVVIEHLDLLLMLDFLKDLELFDETGESDAPPDGAEGAPDGGATLSAPAGSKRYRP